MSSLNHIETIRKYLLDSQYIEFNIDHYSTVHEQVCKLGSYYHSLTGKYPILYTEFHINNNQDMKQIIYTKGDMMYNFNTALPFTKYNPLFSSYLKDTTFEDLFKSIDIIDHVFDDIEYIRYTVAYITDPQFKKNWFGYDHPKIIQDTLDFRVIYEHSQIEIQTESDCSDYCLLYDQKVTPDNIYQQQIDLKRKLLFLNQLAYCLLK